MNTQKLANLLSAIGKGRPAAQLAREMGVNSQSLRGYLRNDGTRPSMETLGAIAAYMKISIDDLIEQISDEPKAKSVKEKGVKYCIATFEELAPIVDNLSQLDKKRLALYAMEAIAV